MRSRRKAWLVENVVEPNIRRITNPSFEDKLHDHKNVPYNN